MISIIVPTLRKTQADLTAFLQSLMLQSGDFEIIVSDVGTEEIDAIVTRVATQNSINRLLQDDSRLVILEFGKPSFAPFRGIYYIYFKLILPALGNLISGNPSAYSYLRDSVLDFESRQELLDCMRAARFVELSCSTLSLGVVNLFVGKKVLTSSKNSGSGSKV